MDDTYLFVDGAYLRETHREAIVGHFGVEAGINFALLLNNTSASRAFYYDCLDDAQRADETPSECEQRLQKQQRFFDNIQSLPGFHVRLGSLAGKGKRKRQKQVDVLLAVEMLDHAVRKNMARVELLTGDLDFAPLIDSVVRHGIWVRLWYEPRTTAKELIRSADEATPISFSWMYQWSAHDFQQRYPLPKEGQIVSGDPARSGWRPLKAGTVAEDPIVLYQNGPNYLLYKGKEGGPLLQMTYPDAAILETYFRASLRLSCGVHIEYAASCNDSAGGWHQVTGPTGQFIYPLTSGKEAWMEFKDGKLARLRIAQR